MLPKNHEKKNYLTKIALEFTKNLLSQEKEFTNTRICFLRAQKNLLNHKKMFMI